MYQIIPDEGQTLTREDAEAVRSIVNRRVNEFGVSEANVQLIGGSDVSVADRLLVQIPVQNTVPSLELIFDLAPYDPEAPGQLVDIDTIAAYIRDELEYEDVVAVEATAIQNQSPFAFSPSLLTYRFSFSELLPERVDEEGNVVEPSDADRIAEGIRGRYPTYVRFVFIAPEDPVAAADGEETPTEGEEEIPADGEETPMEDGEDEQETDVAPAFPPSLEDVEATFFAVNHPEAIVRTFAVDDTTAAAFEAVMGPLSQGSTAEDGTRVADDLTLLVAELSKLGNLLQIAEQGHFTYSITGGVEEAKRLIGSTARLEFRERRCGLDEDKPDDLTDAEWQSQRCSNPLYFVEQDTGIDAEELQNASYEFRPDAGHVVNIEFNQEGSQDFFDVTNRIAISGDRLAIYLDNRELVAPTASRPIPNGRAYIYGGFTQDEARAIAIQVRSGSLPASLDLVQERDVDAALGSDSLRRSLIAGAIGLGLLASFIIAYYKVPGIVATLTLVFYSVVLLAIFKLTPVTLTLSGGAAVILSLGFAVDANILVSERIKEEIRTGRALLSSMAIGFSRAWPSIRDGSFSTLIITIVLFWFGDRFGTSVMQGFALTLGIGILLSILTAFFVNQAIMRLLAVDWVKRRTDLFLPVVSSQQQTDSPSGLVSPTATVDLNQSESAGGETTKLNLLSRARIFGIASASLVIISVVLIFGVGLPLGIDFRSGTSITYEWENSPPDLEQVRAALSGAGYSEAVIQGLGDGRFFIRTPELEETEKNSLDESLRPITGELPRTLDLTTVGQSVAENTVRNSIIAVVVASVFVMLYVIWAFRSVPHSYRYATAAVIALTHDVAITLGLFVVFGAVFGAQVNTAFIVGILTIIGYSVNDTIVVFDRIRENALLVPSRPFRETVALSLRETLVRSLGTSVTTLLVLLSMLLFGGQTLRDFLLVLTVGVIVGTYSSIFIASAILAEWEERGVRGFIQSILRRREPEQTAGRIG